MEIIDKIREEIAAHENEIARLRSALRIVEKLAGKPAKAAPPLITISGVSHQKKPDKRAPRQKATEPKVPLEKQVVMLLRATGRPMRAADIMRQLDLGTLNETTVYSRFKAMQAKHILDQDEKRLYGLPGMFSKPDAPTEERPEEAA
jgi:hypothetical protein